MGTNIKKKRILLAAVELLQTGITNISVETIAMKAGCSRSAINYYFGTKEYLINSAQEIIMNQSNLDVVLQRSRVPHFFTGTLNLLAPDKK